MSTFGIHTTLNRARTDGCDTITAIRRWALTRKVDVILSPAAGQLVGDESVADEGAFVTHTDIVLSVGGDGAILSAARLVSARGLPILGINLGSLGFMTETLVSSLERDLNRILEGEYHLDERMTLDTRLDGQTLPPALNDVVVDRGAVGRMIKVDLFCGDAPIATYRADGLIIATPTGSTAYSLSAGGPILDPSLEAIVASPISPFGFSNRPIVFPANVELEMRLSSEGGSPALSIDGQVHFTIPANSRVAVRRGNAIVRLIRFEGSSFYESLRQKLHWGTPPELRGNS